MPTSSKVSVTRTINGHRWIITIEGGEYVGRTSHNVKGVEVGTEVRADNFRTFRIMVCDATTGLALSA